MSWLLEYFNPSPPVMYNINTLLVFAGALAMHLYLKKRNHGPLPPGPTRWPLLGNLLQMPTEKEWLTYTEWSKIYGKIFFLEIFGQPIVVLNTPSAAIELMHKRSSIYSDRASLPFAGDMIGWKDALVLVPYGDHFRKMRRLTHQLFSPTPAREFWRAEEQENVKFLNRLLETPDKLISHIRLTAGAVILKISHGYTVSDYGNDPFVSTAEKAVEQFCLATVPGAFLVDLFPLLKYVPAWMPGAKFRRTAIEWRKGLLQMVENPHSFTKKQMALGTAIPSFTSKLLEGEYSDETEQLVKWTALSIYGAGSDTTVASISTFFLAMCLYPEVQTAAQAELDAVVGNQRLPLVSDRPSLPYIEAILKEVLRWSPVGPNGVPHRLTEDDFYEGYWIPKGSIVISNIWAMMRNPDTFPEPDVFRPERYLGPNKPDLDPLQIAFGFGRRICPGQHLAEPAVFITIAMTLATFTISKARNKSTGEIIEPKAEWVPGLISHPVPFACDIKPRSSHSVDLIKQALAASTD